MTKFEKNQKPEVFVGAGRKAFALEAPSLGIRLTCTYTNKKHRDLWTAGYKNAEREARYRRTVYSNAEAKPA